MRFLPADPAMSSWSYCTVSGASWPSLAPWPLPREPSPPSPSGRASWPAPARGRRPEALDNSPLCWGESRLSAAETASAVGGRAEPGRELPREADLGIQWEAGPRIRGREGSGPLRGGLWCAPPGWGLIWPWAERRRSSESNASWLSCSCDCDCGGGWDCDCDCDCDCVCDCGWECD